MLWCQHWDNLGEPKGELSVDVISEGSGFAILAPFVVGEAITTTYMVADVSTLEDAKVVVIRLEAKPGHEYAYDFWEAPYSVDDWGRVEVGALVSTVLVQPELRAVVSLAISARGQETMLDPSLPYAEAVRVAIGMLEILDD
jgi:hypothetical protein